MLESLLVLVIVIAVLCLVYWAIHQLADAYGLPKPIVVTLDVLLVLVGVLILLRTLVPLLGVRWPG